MVNAAVQVLYGAIAGFWTMERPGVSQANKLALLGGQIRIDP